MLQQTTVETMSGLWAILSSYPHYVQYIQVILIMSLCSLVVRDDKSRQGSMLDIVVRKNSRMKANEAQLITVFNFF